MDNQKDNYNNETNKEICKSDTKLKILHIIKTVSEWMINQETDGN